MLPAGVLNSSVAALGDVEFATQLRHTLVRESSILVEYVPVTQWVHVEDPVDIVCFPASQASIPAQITSYDPENPTMCVWDMLWNKKFYVRQDPLPPAEGVPSNDPVWSECFDFRWWHKKERATRVGSG